MGQAANTPSSFVQVETIHQAEVSWWWRGEWLHDNSYKIKVADSVDRKIKDIIEKYDVEDDGQYCTQWEGRLLIGTDLQKVTAAANELARHMAKFKGLASIQELSGT